MHSTISLDLETGEVATISNKEMLEKAEATLYKVIVRQ